MNMYDKLAPSLGKWNLPEGTPKQLYSVLIYFYMEIKWFQFLFILRTNIFSWEIIIIFR